ncbi:sensor domain-containing diguanylate cyclase [Nitratiruptor sp. SB155-2]|uniref:sensor domain-containing diguanylate cyclase n=1 Tax=Nitratiruptor sp. (strain SB155-2) TaxID=387092 RepID=UPI0001587253|nr:diguanylate cyclase [Nitratiruptor sp. SB155-2]BAF69808.1 signal transduction response regulator [Nitratiruptor sp. SB155-2]
MRYKREFFISFVLFVIGTIIFGMIIYADYKNKKDIYLQTILHDQEKFYLISKENLHALADLIFKELIDDKDVKRAFATRDRKQLYTLLNDDYIYLKKLGLRQLHFHLPDLTSFLRFHRPNIYGDSLAGVRYSIEEVKKRKQELHCFEEGRIFSGFRNVYPVFYHSRYIGSVEISFSPYAVAKILKKYFPKTIFALILKKEIVDKKVFTHEKRNYIAIPHTGYYWDKNFLNKIKIAPKDRKILERELAKIDLTKEQIVDVDHYHALLTLPIRNCQGEYVGDFIILQHNRFLTRLYYLFIKYYLLGFVLLIALFFVFFLYLKQSHIYIDTLKDAALKDSLTHLFNRRALKSFLKTLKPNSRFGIIFCDIDHFKNFNDRYGHDKGDEVLQEVAKTLSKFVRKDDFLARWGGEEFLIVLPNISLEDLKNRAEKMRQAIENISKDIPVTCSFGVTVCEDASHIDECIKRADEALYRAKEKGRNRVEVI